MRTHRSGIPEESIERLPPPTRSIVDRSVKTARKLGARRAFFLHIGHDRGRNRSESLLPPPIRLAYDGLEVIVGGDA